MTKRFGVIVEDKDGNRIEGVKVELTDFETGHEFVSGPIWDNGFTDDRGFVALDPVEHIKEKEKRAKKIKEMFG